MNKEEFIKKVNELNVIITEEIMNKLDIYCNYLIEYNEHTNLTAITEENEIYLKHFYDSLTIVKAIDLNKYDNIIDVGTGAGFPGLVLKIFYPNLKVTLLDSNNKKIKFLKELSSKLLLKDITIIHDRVENFILNNKESYELVTARAVTNLTALSELCLPLVKIGGYFIPMKGSNKEELEEAKYAISILGGKIINTINFGLPYDKGERNILKIEKVKNTPKEYPRKYEKIKNKPLKKNGK